MFINQPGRAAAYQSYHHLLLVHGQVTIIFVVCRVFLSRLWCDFDQTRTHVVCLGL